jgi:hypothetical protein
MHRQLRTLGWLINLLTLLRRRLLRKSNSLLSTKTTSLSSRESLKQREPQKLLESKRLMLNLKESRSQTRERLLKQRQENSPLLLPRLEQRLNGPTELWSWRTTRYADNVESEDKELRLEEPKLITRCTPKPPPRPRELL